MTDTDKQQQPAGAKPPRSSTDEAEEGPPLGPTGPANVEGEDKPEKTTDNAKGGYGAG